MRISDWSSDVCSSDLFASRRSRDAERRRGRASLPGENLQGTRPGDRGDGARLRQGTGQARADGRARSMRRHRRDRRLRSWQKIQATRRGRSEEHTSELQSLMRISYAVFCLKKKKRNQKKRRIHRTKVNTTAN